MNKRALDWYSNWVEYFFIILIIVGFIVGLLATNAFVNYMISLILGMIIGRVFYLKRKFLPFPRYLIATGLVLGFLIGSFRVSWKGLLFIFFIGAIIGYRIHKYNVIKEYF